MANSQPNPHSQADSAWKHVLHEYFELFMHFFYPDLAKKINWQAGYVVLDQELLKLTPKAAISLRRVDKLVQVETLDGQPFCLLLHTEIQGEKDKLFEPRVFQYFYRVYDKYGLPILTLVILTDTHRYWRPCYYTQKVWDYPVLHFQFLVNKLLDYEGQETQLIESSNPFGTIVAAHLAALKTRSQPKERYASKLAMTRRLYEKGLDKEAIINLYHFIDGVMALPSKWEKLYNQSIAALEQEKDMAFVTSMERFGIEKGLKRGRKEGKKEALEITVMNMLKNQLPMELIAKITGFTLEKIASLAEKLQPH